MKGELLLRAFRHAKKKRCQAAALQRLSPRPCDLLNTRASARTGKSRPPSRADCHQARRAKRSKPLTSCDSISGNPTRWADAPRRHSPRPSGPTPGSGIILLCQLKARMQAKISRSFAPLADTRHRLAAHLVRLSPSHRAGGCTACRPARRHAPRCRTPAARPRSSAPPRPSARCGQISTPPSASLREALRAGAPNW